MNTKNIIFYRTKNGRIRWFDKNSTAYKIRQFKEAKKYNVKKITEKFDGESNSFVKKLNKEEKYSIKKYTKNSLEEIGVGKDNKFYRKLNDYLENQLFNKTYKDPKLEKHAEAISSGISKYKLNEEIVCFRKSKEDK